MGDKIDDLAAAVDLLRRRVQQQEQTIAAQEREIGRLSLAMFPYTLDWHNRIEERLRLLSDKISDVVTDEVWELEERVFPGTREKRIAEYRERRAANKLHDDDRDG